MILKTDNGLEYEVQGKIEITIVPRDPDSKLALTETERNFIANRMEAMANEQLEQWLMMVTGASEEPPPPEIVGV